MEKILFTLALLCAMPLYSSQHDALTEIILDKENGTVEARCYTDTPTVIVTKDLKSDSYSYSPSPIDNKTADRHKKLKALIDGRILAAVALDLLHPLNYYKNSIPE